MALHEALFSALGPFLIPVVLFALGGTVYVVLWWLGRVGDDGTQR
jgi:hypothetical protein